MTPIFQIKIKQSFFVPSYTRPFERASLNPSSVGLCVLQIYMCVCVCECVSVCVCVCVCMCVCVCVLQMHDKFAIYSGSHLRRQHSRTHGCKIFNGFFFAFFCVWPRSWKSFARSEGSADFFCQERQINKSASPKFLFAFRDFPVFLIVSMKLLLMWRSILLPKIIFKNILIVSQISFFFSRKCVLHDVTWHFLFPLSWSLVSIFRLELLTFKKSFFLLWQHLSAISSTLTLSYCC